MSTKHKFSLTLKDRSLKYFVRIMQAVETWPRDLSLQLLAKRLMASTLELTVMLLRPKSNDAIANLEENQMILQAIEILGKGFSPLLQSLLIETKELIFIVEAAGRRSKS